ncbi:TetR family transcriptional regulator [Streptomyces sp. NBC_01381]|uniref:TetR/AcrR family transcriptional regulator n=1 Tax=Streptomyces sp. NBC_01381 TaxID=2903845 RepID=UPI0022506D7A|nr:TetR/AcrR family transcriptional regulator [Streptomyces sp. NBC_01381]MCX4673279.1 TetR family transcriptional regulator [Streptomyces sp. NBC_01381]
MARRRDGQVARDRMLEEAMTAIAENGLAALTMSALADRLGTSGGHILYYFGSKDRLLLEALRWSEAALAEERRALLAGRTAPARKLDRFLRMYLPAGPRDPRWMLWIELWARAGANEPLRTAQDELDHGWQQDLEALLTQGADRGVLTVDDAAGRAGELLALLDGLSTRVVLGQRGADRGGALASARSAAERLIGRPEPTGA